MGKERKEKARDWCLGYEVPVIISYHREKTDVWRNTQGKVLMILPAGDIVENGTVAALDPRQENHSEKQPRGLFLDGPVVDFGYKEIREKWSGGVITVKTLDGRDITKYIKMSFGPGL
jgi:hypothetical protein